jgi:hypothetical protein
MRKIMELMEQPPESGGRKRKNSKVNHGTIMEQSWNMWNIFNQLFHDVVLCSMNHQQSWNRPRAQPDAAKAALPPKRCSMFYFWGLQQQDAAKPRAVP